jgi:hypothetical protein
MAQWITGNGDDGQPEHITWTKLIRSRLESTSTSRHYTHSAVKPGAENAAEA